MEIMVEVAMRKRASKPTGTPPQFDVDDAANQVATECLLYRSRMTARAVTRYFAEGFRKAGIANAPQFSLLVAIKRDSHGSLVALAERLGLERSTLVRNIQTLEAEGLVDSDSIGPGIAKRLRLTPRGEQALVAAFPVWREMQDRLVEELVGTGPLEARLALRSLGQAALRLQDAEE
jgi:DNA-binding MarR family transcriptional regulator